MGRANKYKVDTLYFGLNVQRTGSWLYFSRKCFFGNDFRLKRPDKLNHSFSNTIFPPTHSRSYMHYSNYYYSQV